jgi:hypothetical protein
MEMHFDKATNINVVMWKCGNVKNEGRKISGTHDYDHGKNGQTLI